MNKQKAILFSLATVCLSVPTYAQIKLPVKGIPALNKNVVRTLVRNEKIFHPVFGYTAPLLPTDLAKVYPVTSDKAQSLDLQHTQGLIQTAPILSPANEPLKYIQAFSHTNSLSVAQLTQATYLYRMAHPTHQPGTNTQDLYLSGLLQKSKSLMTQSSANLWQREELPSIGLLTRLQKAAFMPNSYAELVRLFPEYPKHVTLNEEGIPVKTSQADMASVLDTYLMLSNRKQLGAFNNTKQGANYTPFILTPEEHAAANELLKSRLQNEQIPANPFADDLIEIAYNRLESHTIPYTQAAEAGAGYKAYPNYKNTALYRTIQGMIEGQEPDVFIDTYHRILKNDDITHLIVLDAIMGGVELTDLKHADRALRAFDEFTADLEDTPENIAHVQVLQQNLRIVFEPYIEYNRNMPYNSIDGADALGWHAHELLDMTKARNLVGRNWK
ncbi:hypothetical protein [Candidatus Avelusimicrobium caledoniensis]|uniref:hypothetical protein n=1 Tax=Candidatus Avelusimicrobium caledoniensis TaxID=3416220 RepID=UPI003D0A29CA